MQISWVSTQLQPLASNNQTNTEQYWLLLKIPLIVVF